MIQNDIHIYETESYKDIQYNKMWKCMRVSDYNVINKRQNTEAVGKHGHL